MKRIFSTLAGIAMLAALSTAYSADSSDLAAFNNAYERYLQLREDGNWGDALPHAKTSYELGLVHLSEDPKRQAELAYNFGINLSETGRRERAAVIFTEAVDIYETAYGKNAVELVPVNLELGKALAGQAKVVASMRPFNKAIKIAAKNYGKDSADYAQVQADIGAILFDRARSRDAKKFLERGYKGLVKTLGMESPRTGTAAYYLAKYEFAAHYFKDGIEHLNQTLATFPDPEKPSTDIEYMTHAMLVQGYVYLGQTEKATRHCLAVGRMYAFSPSNPLGIVAPRYNGAGEGSVTLRFDVDENGFVRNLELDSLDGSESIVDIAMVAVEKFRYAPRFENGEPVVTTGVKHRFSFNQTVK